MHPDCDLSLRPQPSDTIGSLHLISAQDPLFIPDVAGPLPPTLIFLALVSFSLMTQSRTPLPISPSACCLKNPIVHVAHVVHASQVWPLEGLLLYIGLIRTPSVRLLISFSSYKVTPFTVANAFAHRRTFLTLVLRALALAHLNTIQ